MNLLFICLITESTSFPQAPLSFSFLPTLCLNNSIATPYKQIERIGRSEPSHFLLARFLVEPMFNILAGVDFSGSLPSPQQSPSFSSPFFFPKRRASSLAMIREGFQELIAPSSLLSMRQNLPALRTDLLARKMME